MNFSGAYKVMRRHVEDKYDLLSFVGHVYDQKDTMHDWSHILRVFSSAEKIVCRNALIFDHTVLIAGLILHGVIYEKNMETKVCDFLSAGGADTEFIDKAIKVAWESQKDHAPETREGGIMHDAHLLEGDANFLITKILVTGSSRGQKLDTTVNYFFEHVVTLKPNYCFRSTRIEYEKRLRRAKTYFTSLSYQL